MVLGQIVFRDVPAIRGEEASPLALFLGAVYPSRYLQIGFVDSRWHELKQEESEESSAHFCGPAPCGAGKCFEILLRNSS
jgi:hypothetical protein